VIGEWVNNYQIVSLLGEGGMGAVYLAEHPFMGRKAAIKVLRKELADDRGLVERFMNEARAANAIRHPNIIDIIDVGQLASGIPYLMMELLEGESLAKRIERERPVPVAETVDVAMQTASALRAAHEKGIVHLDLKPDNLFLVPEPGRSFARVKVLDFGIAKLRGELSGSGAATQTGLIMGTPPYMSPEQCRGISDRVDHRTDVYALGIILYEMLTGAPPFVSAGWGEVVHMHISQPPQPPRARNPAISIGLEAIILKALAKDPALRWSSMAEIGAALQQLGPSTGAGKNRGAASSMYAVSRTAFQQPTTLQSSTGQIGTAPANARVATDPAPIGRPWWRRTAMVALGGAALAAIAIVGVVAQRSARLAPAPAEVSGTGAGAAATPLPLPTRVPVPPQSSDRLAPAPAPVQATAPSTAELAARSATTPARPVPREPALEDEKREAPPIAGDTTATARGSREPKRVHPKKSAHRARSEPLVESPPPRAKPSCDPNFYLDAQGDKHFKPECF